jgi:hypothetical protein
MKQVLAFSLFYMAIGAAVALGTFALIGEAARHLPGGSLGSGLMAFWFPMRSLPRWLLCLIGAISGLIGWALVVLFV